MLPQRSVSVLAIDSVSVQNLQEVVLAVFTEFRHEHVRGRAKSSKPERAGFLLPNCRIEVLLTDAIATDVGEPVLLVDIDVILLGKFCGRETVAGNQRSFVVGFLPDGRVPSLTVNRIAAHML